MTEPFDILAVGDVAARRDDPATIFAHVAPLLHQGAVVFGQLEAPVSDRGEPAPQAKLAMRSPPSAMRAMRDAGFSLMSFAGNHCLDWGRAAFRDTRALAESERIRLAGAGETLAEASAPAIQTHDGTRIALVAASSILPAGYGATADRPGCMPMWAHTLYEQIETDQPATAPRIRSYPDPDDLANLLATIEAARATADIVLVSLHWGIHMVTGSIAEYQRTIAAAAIGAGADAILGHHPHLLKGVEFIAGRPVFYSLGNFAIEQPQAFDHAITRAASFRHLLSLNPHSRPEALYVLPEETRITGIAALEVRDGRIAGVSFRPCRVGDDSAPVPLETGDPHFAQTCDYLRDVSAREGLDTRFDIVDGRIAVRPA